jgi:exopolysaccharide production protein ExoZ
MFFYVFFALAMLLPLRRGIAAIVLLFGLFMTIGAFGPSGNVPLDFWTSSLLGEFLFGVVIGLVARNCKQLPLASALTLAADSIALFITLGPLWSFGDGLPDVIRSGLPAAMLVAARSLGPDVRRVQITEALGFVGGASYALYLVHPFAIRPMREVWASKIGNVLPLTLYVVIALAFALAVAIALHMLFERPVTKSLNNWRARKSTSVHDAAAIARQAA